MFTEDGKFDTEFEYRIINGNQLMAQRRSHVFNNPELSQKTRLTNLMHELKVADS